MRVVLDTNIFISGFRSGGKPKIALEMAFAGLYISWLSAKTFSRRLKESYRRSLGGPDPPSFRR
jgi:predicted nucleic acid-binding protein